MVHWPSEIFFNWFLTHWPQTKPGWRWSHFFAVERITKLIGIPEKWGPCGDIGGWRIHWAIRNGNPMDFSLENAWEKSLWLINLNLPAPTAIRVLFETETGLGLGVFWSAAPLIHHPLDWTWLKWKIQVVKTHRTTKSTCVFFGQTSHVPRVFLTGDRKHVF